MGVSPNLGLSLSLMGGSGVRQQALADLGTEYRGLSINFLDMSYAIRSADGAEIALAGEDGLSLDFVDEFGISYALRG